jgi:hypothetical protein
MNKKVIRVLNHLLNKGLDSEEIGEVYEYLKDELGINDRDATTKIMLLYRKYSPMLEDGENFSSISDMNVDYDPDDIDDSALALAQHLNTHPFLLNHVGGYYYEYNLDESEYLVGTEKEIRDIFDDRIEDEIDNLKEYNMDYVQRYAKLDMDYVESFAQEEADYYYSNEDPEEVINYLGYQSELESRLSKSEEAEERMISIDNKISDIESEIGDLEYDVDEYKSELEDLEYDVENAESEEDREEYYQEYISKKNDIEGANDEIRSLRIDLESYQSEYDDLENFVDNFDEDEIKKDLAEELEEQYVNSRTSEIVDNIEYDPIRYFKDFGMSEKDIFDNYFDIDEDEMADDLWDNDRAHMLASYDGEEHEEEVNGEYYLIYRTN